MHHDIALVQDGIKHAGRGQDERSPVAGAVWLALIAIALVGTACGLENAAGDESPPQDTSGASVHFPQLAEDRDHNDGLIIGELVLDDGCLYIESNVPAPVPADVDTRFLIVWPHDAELRVSNGEIEIHDGTSQAVVRVGDQMRVGGGGSESVQSGLVPDACQGPYWIAAPGITRFDPAKATQEARSTPRLGIFFHRQEPDDRNGIESALLSGRLVEFDDCLRVYTDEGNSHLIVWPADYALDAVPGEFRILDAGGQIVARVGEKVHLAGGEKETIERSLPGGCPGPYWIVEEIVGTPRATEEL